MSTDPDEKPAAQFSAEEEERILSMRIGGTTVREALEAAIAAGHVLRDADGRLRLAKPPETSPWFRKSAGYTLNCTFLIRFLYRYAYQENSIPLGCRNCYKVKVISQTLRQLMAVKSIAEELPYKSKSGPEVENPQTQALYGSYFYLSSLDEARKAYKGIRAKLDADPTLGPTVKMIIKRGCTEYERAHGPLDNYNFDSRQEEVEAYLRTRFEAPPDAAPDEKLADAMRLLNVVKTAYQIGDDTYKDFTGGKDLYPPIATYDPTGPSNAVAAEKQDLKDPAD